MKTGIGKIHIMDFPSTSMQSKPVAMVNRRKIPEESKVRNVLF